jgi:hypothetical protein
VAVFFIAIGLLFTGIDFHLGTSIAYPEYVKPQGEFLGADMQEGIQNYVTQNILGDHLRVDPLPDVIGCALIIIGAAMLLRHNKRYVSSIALAFAAGVLSVAVRVMPFFINSAALVVTTLLLFTLVLVFKIWMEYRVIYTTVGISDDIANYGTNRRMLFFWWITVFARVFIFCLTVTGLTSVRHWYDVATVLFTLLYVYQLIQTRKFVGTYKVYKEGFNSSVLPDYIREKISGVSFHENRDVSMDELRYTRVLYHGFDGQVKEGELIVHRSIAYQTMRVFYQLYKMEYPIEKIRLVDEYDGDDILSMADNNSSAFNYRTVEGTEELSKHALGLAIDINPRINPYVREDGFFPENGAPYLERDAARCTGEHKDKMIHKNDMAYKIFKHNGFRWGGDWEKVKDYQHFYYRG